MNKTADILIIGGGISGVSIGYFLMKNGAKNVVLLERGFLASGATGRCGAGIRQQWGTELNCLISKHACEFFETASGELEYDGDIEFKQNGYLMLISTEEELKQSKKNVELQNSLGIGSRILDLKQAREIVPILKTDELLAAAFYERDGHLNPFHTTQAFAEAFKRLGGVIYTYTSVTGFLINNGCIKGVDTTAGHISTNIVVNAAGGYAQQVAALAGVELHTERESKYHPLYSERHNILVTEPVEPLIKPMIMSFSLNLYCQQVPHGSVVMGRTCPDQPRDLRVTADSSFPNVMAKTITRFMPPLRNLRMLRQWAGLYNMTEDKHPIYDEIPGVSGFYVAAGYSGRGFMLAPTTGQCMTELILGLNPTLPWEKLGCKRGADFELEPSVV
jgi:sarcosine oxidase subunit beta